MACRSAAQSEFAAETIQRNIESLLGPVLQLYCALLMVIGGTRAPHGMADNWRGCGPLPRERGMVASGVGVDPQISFGHARVNGLAKILRKFRNNRSSTDSQLIVSTTNGWRGLGFKRPAIGAGLCHSFANSFQNFKA